MEMEVDRAHLARRALRTRLEVQQKASTIGGRFEVQRVVETPWH